MNLLAPTYEISARIVAALDPAIKVMLDGYQAKAMPTAILTDPRMSRCEALVIGEGETRVAELLVDHRFSPESLRAGSKLGCIAKLPPTWWGAGCRF